MPLFARYKPMANLPTVNNSAVSSAPGQTCFQVICTSGSSLKSHANSTVLKASDTSRLTPSSTSTGSGSVSKDLSSTAMSVLATSSRNNSSHDSSTASSEYARSWMMAPSVRPGLGCTCQMELSASCN